MTNKKKIALLNLPVDGNYGGHLQRFALVRTLQSLGYDVEHLNTRFTPSKSLIHRMPGRAKRLLTYAVQCIKRSPNRTPLRYAKYYIKNESLTEAFYNKYIPHTKRINSKKELAEHQSYITFVVGSDQVWRNTYTQRYGLGTYFFDYLSDSARRIAYAASFGTNDIAYSAVEIQQIKKLYNKFLSVSVREQDGLNILQTFGYTSPRAIHLLDPTLLLTKEEYQQVIAAEKTHALEGEIFCYLLDPTEYKLHEIECISREKKMQTVIVDLHTNMSAEQWLRSFADAKYVITDSYHGLLFSLIFEKEFKLYRNDDRGNSRFETILNCLEVNLDCKEQDWQRIRNNVTKYKVKALEFLKNNIG